MSQHLGFVEARVNSLPWEIKSRQMVNARILEAAVKTPTPGVSEAYLGRPAGLGALVESYPGGAYSVTVNSLGPDLSSRWVGPDSLDRFAITQDQRARFKEFATAMISEALGQSSRWNPGRYREMGPRAGGDPTSYGSRPNDDFGGFPHRPGYKPGNVSGYTSQRPGFLRPSYDREEDAEVTYSGDQDRKRRTLKRREPEIQDEEEEAREHVGIACRLVHGQLPHRAWTEYFDSVGGGRIRIRAR